MKKKSQKKLKARRDWAAALEHMAKPPMSTRLPALIARPIRVVTMAKHCSWCRERGHNMRTCTNPKARGQDQGTRRVVAPPVITHKVLVARREIALRTLHGGDKVLHAAYDESSQTLQVAFRGTFMVHWYAYANVPSRVYGKLAQAKNPDVVVAEEIDSKYTKTYVHRRKMLPARTK
jgi:hypothetical protein